MKKFAGFIVKNRGLFILLFAVMLVYCIIGIPKVNIENSISAFLPDSTDTKQAIDIMENEFVTYGASKIMVRNVTYAEAEKLAEQIRALEGVKSLVFENTEDYYRQSCALFNITYTGDSENAAAVKACGDVSSILEGYDVLEASSLTDDYVAQLIKDMALILALAAAVIILVLLFTSKSFAEVAVFPIIFVVAAVLNMGTNFWMGTVSVISQSVCIVLQLALAIDYAIILCHRFTEEKEKDPSDAENAMAAALSKAIPEISGSCLTTIAGLIALTFMQLKLGADLGLVLAKSIVCSILTVFFLMPGVMLMFSKLMDKSRHRNFVPRIDFLGKGVLKLKVVLPVVFAVLFAVCAVLQQQTVYVYSTNSIDTSRPTDAQIAVKEIENIFGYENMFVILLPKGDYEKEREVLDLVQSKTMITSALGVSNIEISDGIYLSDSLDYKRFSDLTGLGYENSKYVYYIYAVHNEQYWVPLNDNIDIYNVPLLDILDFAVDLVDDGYFSLSEDMESKFDDIKEALQDVHDQLIGENYTRLVFNIDGPMESAETFALIEEMQSEVKTLYPGAIFAGESMSAYDLNESFVSDNLLINVLTVAFIFIILMFTFKSWGLPIVLVSVIQGAIFINFAVQVMTGSNLFFFVYLIVSAIQMGATIDYAIVITSRYTALRAEQDKKNAVVNALSDSFPTIITSGTIMTAAALLIGFIVKDPLIASIGMCLGRGTIISILCVMTVLPVLLYIFDRQLNKTFFKLPKIIELPKGGALAGTLKALKNPAAALRGQEENEQLIDEKEDCIKEQDIKKEAADENSIGKGE